jgi:tRNA U34 2-thiouridine synthase MnmA/TrmU
MKAIALLSGGLDSTLAAKVVKDQGIEVIGVHFQTSFGLKEKGADGRLRNRVAEAAAHIGVELRTIDISDDFLRMLKKPAHGFGSNMNPCIDCKILMLAKTRRLMDEWGASFAVTGEVLGQRPMSQHRRALAAIERESGLTGLLLRPLCARLLDPTIAEEKGWIDREKLLNFSGRTRKPQMALAKDFGYHDYPCSAGGCLLTDPEFSKRLKDFMTWGELTRHYIGLLRVGRFFRLAEKTRLVIGRNEQENNQLVELAGAGDYIFEPKELAGPTSLGRGVFDEALIVLACQITSSYCDRPAGTGTAEILYRKLPDGQSSTVVVCALEHSQLTTYRL